jgi:hypothetical protein
VSSVILAHVPDETGISFSALAAYSQQTGSDPRAPWIAATITLGLLLVGVITLTRTRRKDRDAERDKAATVFSKFSATPMEPMRPDRMLFQYVQVLLKTEIQLRYVRITVWPAGDRSKTQTQTVGPISGTKTVYLTFKPPIEIMQPPVITNPADLFALGPVEYEDFNGVRWVRNGEMPPVRRGAIRTWMVRCYDRLVTWLRPAGAR